MTSAEAPRSFESAESVARGVAASGDTIQLSYVAAPITPGVQHFALEAGDIHAAFQEWSTFHSATSTVMLRRPAANPQDLLPWWRDIVEGRRDAAIREATITLFDHSGKALLAWKLTNAWPSKLTLGAIGEHAGFDELTITYEYETRLE